MSLLERLTAVINESLGNHRGTIGWMQGEMVAADIIASDVLGPEERGSENG